MKRCDRIVSAVLALPAFLFGRRLHVSGDGLRCGTLRHCAALSLLVALGAPVLACAGLQQPPPPPQTIEVQYLMPKVDLAEGSTAELEKDGVKIIVAAQPFTPVRKMATTITPMDTPIVVNDKYYYQVRRTPTVAVSPQELRFKVRVINHLEHVLKMAGTVLSYTASGKQLPVPKANYEEFLNGIIRPRQEMEFEVVGPSLASLPGNTNLSFALDDVVTATDPAGNPSKRMNFEWILAIQQQPVSEPGTVEVQQVRMTQAEYQQAAAQAQGR